MEFKWKKCATNRKTLVERPEIAVWRTGFLHEIKHRRVGKKQHIRQTYVQKSHSAQSCWQSEEESGV